VNLKPIYRFGNIVLIGLAEDYQNETVHDGLVLEIDILNKRIVNNP